MLQNIHHHTFPNGLTLLAERMDDVRSAAFNFLIPSGCAYDPPEQSGTATVLAEMLTRGAGDRDVHDLTLDLDNLGLDRSESVGKYHIRLWGATLARNLPACLDIYADILRRPQLDAEELEAVKSLAQQDLIAMEDQPGQLLGVELSKLYLPRPLCNERRGTPEGIRNITAESLRAHWKRQFGPQRCILSVAGNIDWEALVDQVGKLLGDWRSEPVPLPSIGHVEHRHSYLKKETTQTWIGMACPSVPVTDDAYYNALGAVNVLSGGMSARLFTEVREKRGLCYSVRASYLTFKDRGFVLGFASTTNERAQETLDVTLSELKRLREGIEEEEVERVQAGMKSSLIMQQESTSARAGSLASDWYHFGRIRSPEEIQSAVGAITPESILGYLEQHPLENFVIATLGPEPLNLPT